MQLAQRVLVVALAALSFAPVTATQTVFHQLPAYPAPPSRGVPGIAYDAGRDRAVLFGGYFGSAFPRPADTWEWDGAAWQQINPATSPTGRESHGMAYDPGRGRTVLFGGTPRSGFFDDTWEWDGTRWVEVVREARPSERMLPAMTFDGCTGEVLLFGGVASQSNSDTWSWNGSRWRQHEPENEPPAREASAMVYDARRQRTVLFGGRTINQLHNDTWAWDGQDWTRLILEGGPPPRWGHHMVWDEARDRIVVFGGTNNARTLGDVWELGPNGWIDRTPTNTPLPRRNGAAFYDPVRGRMVVYGGMNGGIVLGDTWEYLPAQPAGYVAFGSGCAGSLGTPALVTDPWQAPWAGETFQLQIHNLVPGNATVLLLGASNATWGALNLPLGLAPVMPGCTLLCSGEVALPVANPTGTATVDLQIPRTRSLIGGNFFNQAFTADAGINPLGLVTSDAGTATIGRK